MVHRRLKQSTRNRNNNTVNGILPLNRWLNGENQPRSQSILVRLYQLSARQLDKIVISSRILV